MTKLDELRPLFSVQGRTVTVRVPDEHGEFAVIDCTAEARALLVEAQAAAAREERALEERHKAVAQVRELDAAVAFLVGQLNLGVEQRKSIDARVQALEAENARLRERPSPPSPSARPETLEECWKLIEYLDTEIVGAVHDRGVAFARVRELEDSAKKRLTMSGASDGQRQQQS